MILIVVLAALAFSVIAVLLRLLLREQIEPAARVDYDVAVYRDQLAEIGGDVERGLLLPGQADAARTEIYRRMLAAEGKKNSGEQKSVISTRSKIFPLFLILVFLPVGAGLTYGLLGSPELPGQPYAARKNQPAFLMQREADNLAAQLEARPDAAGFKQLADIYFAQRRYDQAAIFYQKSIEMKGTGAVLWSALGEALALGHEGVVGPDARRAFVKALSFDPQDARARFYMELAQKQRGS